MFWKLLINNMVSVYHFEGFSWNCSVIVMGTKILKLVALPLNATECMSEIGVQSAGNYILFISIVTSGASCKAIIMILARK